MARCAGTVAAAGVVEADSVVQSDVEDRLLFAVIFVGKLVVFELDGFALGQKSYLNDVLAGCIHGRGSCSLCFIVCHTCSFAAQLTCRALLGRTAEGGCPRVIKVLTRNLPGRRDVRPRDPRPCLLRPWFCP